MGAVDAVDAREEYVLTILLTALIRIIFRTR